MYRPEETYLPPVLMQSTKDLEVVLILMKIQFNHSKYARSIRPVSHFYFQFICPCIIMQLKKCKHTPSNKMLDSGRGRGGLWYRADNSLIDFLWKKKIKKTYEYLYLIKGR